jgi:hypothetical protein
MAHFARVDDGIVREVVVIDNADCGGGDFPESELIGQAFIDSIGLAGEWRQTSYSSSFRGTYAGQGFTYDSDLDEFVAPAAPEVETPIEP